MATRNQAEKARDELVKQYRDQLLSAGVSTRGPGKGWYISVSVSRPNLVDKIPHCVNNVEVRTTYTGPVRAFSG